MACIDNYRDCIIEYEMGRVGDMGLTRAPSYWIKARIDELDEDSKFRVSFVLASLDGTVEFRLVQRKLEEKTIVKKWR